MRLFALHCFIFSLFFCQTSAASGLYSILEEKDHDSYIFTQGFVIEKGVIYESSGLYGKSFVRVYQEEDDKILVQKRLPRDIFAEGMTLFDGLLYLLSWQAEELFILNPQTLKTIHTLNYQGEGWGLAHDGQSLIMSNGSQTLTFRDPTTFAITRSVTPKSLKHPLPRFNELEYALGAIWANSWLESLIYKIDPQTGAILATYDLSELTKINSTQRGRTVLNGIAYDGEREAFWVTGKHWPKRYLVKFK